ncbi:MAG: hypothetical protein RSG53_00030 [Oscillospiraceae bacterium]
MDFAVSFLAILAIAAFFIVRFKLNASVAPFASIALITLFLCYMGTLNLLMPAVYIIFAFAVFSLVYIFWIKRKELCSSVKAIFTPGMTFFIVASLGFLIAVGIKNPYFTFWDEFSFWGIAAKTLFEHQQVYTLFTSSMINISYPPGLPIFSFFMQCTSTVFREWRVYLAYDILIMSVMSMLFARVKWRNYITIPVLSFTAISCLYLFWYSFEGLKLYVTSYSDVPVGVVFGGALLAYFATSEERNLWNYLAALLGLMLLPMIKDIGLAFGLVAAVIMSFDMIVSKNYPTKTVFKSNRGIFKAIYPLILFVGLILSYQIWTLHFAAATSISRVSVPYEFGIIQMLSGQDPYFNEIFKRMWEALGQRQLLTFGTVWEMIIVFTVIPIIFSLFCKERKNTLRISAVSLMLCGGFFMYYLFQTYAYTAIFSHSNEYSLTSYERYVSSYPIGWMLTIIGLSVFAISLWRFKKPSSMLPGVCVCGLLIFALFHYSPVNFDQYVFTSDKVYQSLLPLRELMANSAAKFNGAFTENDKIYYVCQNSDGGEWFYFNYEFQPAFTEKTLDGGNFIPIGARHVGRYDTEVDAKRFTEFLREKEIDYVFIQKVDDYFTEEFSSMFSDNMIGFYDGTANMYKVTDDGVNLLLVPTYGTKQVQALRDQYGY